MALIILPVWFLWSFSYHNCVEVSLSIHVCVKLFKFHYAIERICGAVNCLASTGQGSRTRGANINGFDHIARVVSMVVFLSQLCWSQFVNTRLCQAFQASLCYRKNLWSRELFGKWRHNRLAKGNAHRVNNAFGDKAAWELSRTHATMPLMNCARVWYRTDQESGNLIGREPELSFVYLQSLLISLINVCANIYVIWNKKNSSQYSCRPRTLLTLICLFIFFFYSLTHRVLTRGIASSLSLGMTRGSSFIRELMAR